MQHEYPKVEFVLCEQQTEPPEIELHTSQPVYNLSKSLFSHRDIHTVALGANQKETDHGHCVFIIHTGSQLQAFAFPKQKRQSMP